MQISNDKKFSFRFDISQEQEDANKKLNGNNESLSLRNK